MGSSALCRSNWRALQLRRACAVQQQESTRQRARCVRQHVPYGGTIPVPHLDQVPRTCCTAVGKSTLQENTGSDRCTCEGSWTIAKTANCVVKSKSQLTQ